MLRTYEPVFVLSVPDQVCMKEAFWCNFPKRTVFGHSIIAMVVVVALVVLSVAQSLRAGKYRTAGAELVINAIAVVTAPDYGGAVLIFSTLVHLYVRRPPRPRVVDFGRAPRLR